MKMMGNNDFGLELVVDLKDCNDSIKDEQALAQYAKELCKVIDMKAYGDPIIKHFGHESPVTSGYTLVQLIETSSIVGHFSDHHRTAHLNIFSCKDFNLVDALLFTVNFFDARLISSRDFVRSMV